MPENVYVAKVTLYWKNGVEIGTEYFYSTADAENFAIVSRGHGKIAKVAKINHKRGRKPRKLLYGGYLYNCQRKTCHYTTTSRKAMLKHIREKGHGSYLPKSKQKFIK